MKMINKLIISFSCILLAGCNSGLPDSGDQEQTGEGEPVNISFNLYNAAVTKADNSSTVTMTSGTAFRIYAFEAGTTNLSTPVATAVYTVGDNGKATGNLSLYRGKYDFYLISNNTNTAPTLDEGSNVVTVDNGNDFMYNTISGEVIQPESPGQNKMTINLRTPFVRLGASIDLSVKAKSGSPVPVSGLKVQSITIKKLSSPLSYKLGEKDWNVDSPSYDETNTFTVNEFTTGITGNPSESRNNIKPVVLLPVDGTVDLLFDLVLNVTYSELDESGNPKLVSADFPYQASATKALIKGMKYKFEFTLTFFGILKPGDMTVSLLDYTQEDLSTDQVGQ